jgi:hypothetical protein
MEINVVVAFMPYHLEQTQLDGVYAKTKPE